MVLILESLQMQFLAITAIPETFSLSVACSLVESKVSRYLRDLNTEHPKILGVLMKRKLL